MKDQKLGYGSTALIFVTSLDVTYCLDACGREIANGNSNGWRLSRNL